MIRPSSSTAANDVSVCVDPRPCEPMCWTVPPAVDDDPVGHQAPVAAPPQRLRAHHRGATSRGQRQQLVDAERELGAQRVIGITAEGVVPPCAVRRVPVRALPAAQAWEVRIGDAVLGQPSRQRIPFVLRVAAGARHRADVRNLFDPVQPQQLYELGRRVRGVPDRPDRGGYRRSGFIGANRRVRHHQACCPRAR